MEFRNRLRLLSVWALLITLTTLHRPAIAKVLLTQQQALAIAFAKGATVERKTAILSADQLAQASVLAGSPINSTLWTYYVGKSAQGQDNTAYFESHKVRTLNETLMIVLNADASVKLIEVLSFAEPDDYRPKKEWLKQFTGKPLSDELFLNRSLRHQTGASITSDAVTRCVRRVLAIHTILSHANPQ